MGLNHAGPLLHGFFSVVNPAVLHDPRLVESARCRTLDVEEPRIRRAIDKLYVDFPLPGGSAPLTPVLYKGQL